MVWKSKFSRGKHLPMQQILLDSRGSDPPQSAVADAIDVRSLRAYLEELAAKL
jgi:hypothetical protein